MGSEIVGKARDAASMFWASLEDAERRILILGGFWLVYTACALVSDRSRVSEREQLKAEIREELRNGR